MKRSLLTFFLLFLVIIILRTSVIGVFYVQSNSMQPLINKGDGIIVNQLAFGATLPWLTQPSLNWSLPEHGDIVVFHNANDNDELWLKRVIGLPGDVIQFQDHKLFLNGLVISSSDRKQEVITISEVKQRKYPTWTSWLEEDWGPITVSKDTIFVMGDHRGASIDSRVWGSIAIQSLRGRATYRFWPISEYAILSDK